MTHDQSDPARPLVSVLTPSYGQARWLADNLESVERQSYANIEHIVADGGSVDGSVEILERHSRPGLLWTSAPDRGQSHALNNAFAQSRGEIIGWLNSDDAYFGPDAVTDAVAVFAADPEAVVVYGHAVLVNAEGLLLQAMWTPPFSRRLLRLQDFISQPTAFIRRSALGVEMVDETYDYMMDYELWLRLAGRGRFRRLNRIVAIDRHHLARKSYTMTDIGWQDHARLRQTYRVAGGPVARAARKAWKIAVRLAGASLVADASNQGIAVGVVRDGQRRLLLRQLTTPRGAMRSGDDLGADQ
jgi:glycosyltransferase involved in cell wall biosynthesis